MIRWAYDQGGPYFPLWNRSRAPEHISTQPPRNNRRLTKASLAQLQVGLFRNFFGVHLE